VDVRVVAATHRDLRKMVVQGRFREDLFYRLSVIEIRVPSMSERKEDFPLLLRHFLESYSALYGKNIRGIARRAQTRLAAHSWPGNVRELENVVSGGCIMAVGNVIDLHDLPESFRETTQASGLEGEDLVSLEKMQQQYLLRVLAHVGGNKAKAAEVLGVGRSTIYQILSRIRVGDGLKGEPVVRSDEYCQGPVEEMSN